MTVVDKKMVGDAKVFVVKLLNKRLSKNYEYHNSKHTLDVFNNAKIIGVKSRLFESDLNVLLMSALFHDVGYIDSMEEHELLSTKYAVKFLNSKNVDALSTQQIIDAILSTRILHQPKDIISKILCDADLMYLAFQSEYFVKAESLRQEWIKTNKLKLNELEFHKKSIKFFNSHYYHSEYGKIILQPKKDKTLRIIQDKVSNLNPMVSK